MHPEAYEYVRSTVAEFQAPPSWVLDIGGRNINGTVKDIFSEGTGFSALDIRPGEGVDIVADAAIWQPASLYDCVICCEVFEHTPDWRAILNTMHTACRVGGHVIVTAAADPRPPHSAIDGHNMEYTEYSSDPAEAASLASEGQTLEFYANVVPDDLLHAMEMQFRYVAVSTHPRGDVYASALV